MTKRKKPKPLYVGSDRLLTTREASYILHTSTQCVRDMCHAHALAHFKRNHLYYILFSEIKKALINGVPGYYNPSRNIAHKPFMSRRQPRTPTSLNDPPTHAVPTPISDSLVSLVPARPTTAVIQKKFNIEPPPIPKPRYHRIRTYRPPHLKHTRNRDTLETGTHPTLKGPAP